VPGELSDVDASVAEASCFAVDYAYRAVSDDYSS
jgi:hypothetical protein